MQMLTRLFTTRIVASSSSTSDSSRSTASEAAEWRWRICWMSLCDSEKKAVSEPDTRAETVSRQSVTTSIAALRAVKPSKVTICVRVSSKIAWLRGYSKSEPFFSCFSAGVAAESPLSTSLRTDGISTMNFELRVW